MIFRRRELFQFPAAFFGKKAENFGVSAKLSRERVRKSPAVFAIMKKTPISRERMNPMKCKKWLALLAAFALTAAVFPFSVSAAPEPVDGNFVRVTTAADFSAAQLTNLTVDGTIGDGAVVLADPSAEGELITGVYDCPAFTNLVASWNADTPADSSVEITVRARIAGTDTWTEWLSWGRWGTGFARGCGTPETARDSLAYVDTDVFTLRDGKQALDQFQMRAVLTGSGGESPVLRQLCATLKNDLEGQFLPPSYAEDPVELPEKVLLPTPAYSQMVRDPDIRASICNPTTITALLNDRGEDLLPEQVALVDYDYNYQGFGNWSFALAAAGSYGYACYIQYGDLDMIRQELAKGYSVGISIRYSPTEGGRLPYVENAPLASTGHLITVRGYETVDGVEYFYVSDSAADTDQEALRRYRADQLDNAWDTRILYLVHEKEPGAGSAAPRTLPAELKPVEGKENLYQLFVNGKAVELPSGFLKNKTLEAGGGTILAYCTDEPAAPQEAPARTTTANHAFLYDFSAKEGSIVVDPARLFLRGQPGESYALTVTVIANTGISYQAPLTVSIPSDDPGDTLEEPSEPASQPEKPAAAAPSEQERSLLWLWIVLGAAAAALVVFVILRKRKK